MKLTSFAPLVLAFSALQLPFSPVHAAYNGDIVGYWNKHVFNLAVIPGHWDPAWTFIFRLQAIVHEAILIAAKRSVGQKRSLEVQQLAISHAAHYSFQSIVINRGPDLLKLFREIEDQIGDIGHNAKSVARKIGEDAARKALLSHLIPGDGYGTYVRYDFVPAEDSLGFYQPTPPLYDFPTEPNGGILAPFGGVSRAEGTRWKTPPPKVNSPEFEEALVEMFHKGANSSLPYCTRTKYETETAFYWILGNGFATAKVAKALLNLDVKFKADTLEAAKFWAKYAYAISNAATLVWNAKYEYNTWRPITAIRYKGPKGYPYLASGTTNYTDSNWTPIANTPTHPDYLSGHAGTTSAASGILQRYIGTDKIDPPVEISVDASSVGLGIIKRKWSSISQMKQSAADSRVFIGAHFRFACTEGVKAGDLSAQLVWDNFDKHCATL